MVRRHFYYETPPGEFLLSNDRDLYTRQIDMFIS